MGKCYKFQISFEGSSDYFEVSCTYTASGLAIDCVNADESVGGIKVKVENTTIVLYE